jgi:hypothetical protein
LESPDVVVLVFFPILAVLRLGLAGGGAPASVVEVVSAVTNLGLYALLFAGLIRVRSRATNPRVALALGVLAFGLLGWIVTHPAPGFESALARGDHLVLAAFGGAALPLLRSDHRLGVLIATSVVVLVLLAGPGPMAIIFTGMASGVAAQRLSASRGHGEAALLQATIMLATLGACRVAETYDSRLGLGAQGLFAFMVMRHVSWVVDVRRGASSSLRDYWCYQLFYPCCYGATECYADFRSRNPALGAHRDEPRLFRVAIRSAVYLWAHLHLPVNLPTMLATSGWLVFFASYLLFFVRSALFLMGTWSALEALALCWGVRIHPNFAGILVARSPSQFWHAWRGTMTRWLVAYVYIPLGGNRSRQVRNVFAVFAVSAAWHAMGVPFVYNEATLIDVVPIMTWALVNAAVLAAALTWRRRGWQAWPAATPALLRTSTALIGTWVFGGVTATFLAFQGPLGARFPEFMLRLSGLR